MRRLLPVLAGGVAMIVLIAFLVSPLSFEPLLAPLAPANAPAIYSQDSLLRLTLAHLATVLLATTVASVIAVSLALLVTRRMGAEFLPLSRSVVAIGQTFPPVAVLALAVPIFGFGETPTLIALILYGLLPVFENALTALSHPPRAVIEAARGAGMTSLQRLVQVELPLAAPLIVTGIRLSAVIGVATATIGSTVAAKTLGEVIIAGLQTYNYAFILQGGLLVAALALLVSTSLTMVELWLTRRGNRA